MTDELAELRTQLDRLQQRVIELETERDELSVERAEAALPRAAVTRRNWMKAAAAAAVGGSVAAVATAQPAAATNGDPISIGQTTEGTNRTRANYTGGEGGVGFLFQSGTTFSGGAAFRPAALAGFANNAAQPSGVYGFSNVNSFEAAGVDGIAGAANGTGVRGRGGESGPGLDGTGGSYGLQVSGDLAAINLVPSSIVPPDQTTDFHQGGELYVREASDSGLAVELWYCTVGGTPGVWTQIAGPFVSGGFYPITPTRVYDSRRPTPDPGTLASGSSRDVDVSQGRDVSTGAATGIAVPEGASAIAYNVTVTNTSGAGFLEVAPTTMTPPQSSTINWSGGGQTLANAGIVRVFNNREVQVSCGGVSATTDFLIDITGYWA